MHMYQPYGILPEINVFVFILYSYNYKCHRFISSPVLWMGGGVYGVT